MKKLFIFALAVIACAITANAQYRYASGPIVGSLYGGSYKMYCSDNIVLQTDLYVGLHKVAGKMFFEDIDYGAVCGEKHWDFALNPNVMYQAPICDVKVGWLNYFAGAGVSAGLAMEYGGSYVFGKIGANAIAGIEYVFEGIPFSVSADFRPGYGYMIGVPLGIKSELHMFDWSIGIALRYYVK